jgi:hypothetical protein
LTKDNPLGLSGRKFVGEGYYPSRENKTGDMGEGHCPSPTNKFYKGGIKGNLNKS